MFILFLYEVGLNNIIKQNSRHYAKRQYMFFNNQFDDINWYNVDDLSLEEVTSDIDV